MAEENGSITIWEVATGKRIAAIARAYKDALFFSDDGSQLITRGGGGSRGWDAATGAEIESLSRSPDVRVPTGGGILARNASSYVLREYTGSLFVSRDKAIAKLGTAADGARKAALSWDASHVVTIPPSGPATLWEIRDRAASAVRAFQEHAGRVWSAAFSPDGALVATAAEDRTARLWDARTGERLALLRGHAAAVTAIEFSPDGKAILTGSRDGTVRIWLAQARNEPITGAWGSDMDFLAASFLPHGMGIHVTASRFALGGWIDVRGGVVSGTGALTCVAICRDGLRSVHLRRDGTVIVWDADEAISEFQATPGAHAIAISQDASRVATACSQSNALVWDARTGERVTTLEVSGDEVRAIAFNSDASRIVTGGETAMRFWSATSGQEIPALRRDCRVSAVAFSPDASRIVTGSPIGSITIWDAANAVELLTLHAHAVSVLSISFSEDGTRLLSGAADGTLRIWDIVPAAQRAAETENDQGA